MIRRTVGLLAMTGALMWTVGSATAQPPIFRVAPTFSLPGLSSDATSLLAVVDVGSLVGPPDGIPDIVVASQTQLAATLFGRPDGSFVGGPNTQLGRIPTAMAVADVTGDGFPDLLITDTAHNLICFRGFDDGPPFQQMGAIVAIEPNPVVIEPYDFNGDGRTDIAILHRSTQGAGEITIRYGLGDCAFEAPPFPNVSFVRTGLGSSALVIDDFNGDGRPDFAVANALDNDVWIILAEAGGTFREVQRISVVPPGAGGSQLVEPAALAAVHLDGDTRKDLVVVNRNGDQVAVLIGQANGLFSTPTFFDSGSAGSSPTALSIADIDGDGLDDVMVANNRSSDVSVLRSNGDGSLLPARSFMAEQEPVGLAATVLAGDALPSLIVSNRGVQGPSAAVLRSLGDGSLVAVENVPTDSTPNDAVIADLDNDGLPDLAVAHSDGVVRLIRAQAQGGFAPMNPGSVSIAGNAIALAAGDFNGDLLTDFVVAGDIPGVVSLFLGRPGGFTAPQTVTLGSGITRMAVGDWNGDGFADLAAVRQLGEERGVVEILRGSSSGLTRTQTVTVGVTPIDLAVGDVNNDGIPDILVANSGSGTTSVLRGRAEGGFDDPATVIVSGALRSLVVADFDRDGCDDFAVGLGVSGAIVPYFGECDSFFSRGPQSFSIGQSPSGLAARDFDGDGIPDIAIVDEVDNRMALYLKLPGNRFFTNMRNDTYNLSRRPVRAGAGDFDGDGRYDAAALNSFVAGSVSILTNEAGAGGLRGDANGDQRLSIADAVAVMRTVIGQPGKRVEDVSQGFARGNATDANGDGRITRQDARALVARLFPRS